MQGILSLDQGTTSTRAIVFNKKGEILCSAQKEHKQIYPHSGFVEHDAEEIFINTLHVLESALKEAEKLSIEVLSLGITNQRETIVCFRKSSGKPLHNALVWQDVRTSTFCQKLHKTHGIEIQNKTGLPVNPYFSASKLKWLLENVKEVQTALDEDDLLCGTMECYLLYRLSNLQAHKSDITNACRTQLYNIHKRTWDNDLLELYNIPAHILPTVTANSEDFGMVDINTLPPLPIQGMIGDQQAALFGQACFHEGNIKSTYGTGCFAMLNTGHKPKRSEQGLLTTIGYQLGDNVYYALEGSIFIAGAVIQWLRDRLQLIETALETEVLARSSEDKDDVYFVPAFTGLGAPYWESNAKASITGMTLSTTKADIVRAALEGVCFETNDLVKAFETDSHTKLNTLKVDGGMVANNFMLERMADILNINIERPSMIETTALGAAYMAGLKFGFYKNLKDIETNWQLDQNFTPSMDIHTQTKKKVGWQKAIQKHCI